MLFCGHLRYLYEFNYNCLSFAQVYGVTVSQLGDVQKEFVTKVGVHSCPDTSGRQSYVFAIDCFVEGKGNSSRLGGDPPPTLQADGSQATLADYVREEYGFRHDWWASCPSWRSGNNDLCFACTPVPQP